MFDKKLLNWQTEKYLKFIENNKISELDEKKIKDIYFDIIETINYNNYLYYIESNPVISDYQYDKLFDYLKNIEYYYPNIISNDSPTQWLNYQIQTEFKKESHTIKAPMLSLDNTYNAEDLKDWDDFIKRKLTDDAWNTIKYSYSIEPKYDWVSIDIVYDNHLNLKKAITRWDWYIWEDVTENIKTIRSIPSKLNLWSNEFIDYVLKEWKWEIRIRWEIVMPRSSFETINNEKRVNWEQLFANTRNATSWSLRQLDPNIVAKRWLEFYPYDLILLDNNLELIDRWEIYDSIDFKKLWFNCINLLNKTLSKSNIDWVIDFCTSNYVLEQLKEYDIDFDWLVIKILPINLRTRLWATSHHPRRAVAYKFPAKQVITKILDIEFSLGRSGVLTPTAKLEPVSLSWVTVSNANLHNMDFINNKDIKIWDYVWIQRSWEVIPYIVWSLKDRRDWTEKIIFPPEKCPACWSKVIRFPDEVPYLCVNINCPWILKEKIWYFVSKEWMEIDWFGEKIVNLLVDWWLISNILDIYKLNQPEIKIKLWSLPLMWKKRVEDLLNQIEKSKNNPLWRILTAIWIKFVGKKTAKIIKDWIIFDYEKKNLSLNDFNIDDLINYLSDEEFLLNIYWIWEKTIQSIKTYILINENIKLLKDLEKIWVKFNNFEIKYDKKIMDWLHFSISGKFWISREKIIEILQKNWSIFDDQPKKSTNFIIIWEDSWSKLKKAQDYWLEIIYWLDWLLWKYDFLKEFFENIDKLDNNKSDKNKPEQISLF